MKTMSVLLAVGVLAACAQHSTSHAHATHGHDHHHAHHAHDEHDHHHAPNYTAWQNYQCTNGQKLRVRYDTQMAEVAMGAQQKVLKHQAAQSHAERMLFSDGQWQWTVDSQHGYTNTLNEANGFLTRHEQQVVNGERMPVDTILAKNCQPVR